MRSIPFALIAGAAIATAACATAAATDDHAQEELSKALAGYAPGKTAECIDLKMVDGPQIISHQALLYRQPGTIWKADVIGPCPSLEPMVTVITDVYGGQLCRNDKFRTLAPGESIPSAYCRLGSFTKYTHIKR